MKKTMRLHIPDMPIDLHLALKMQALKEYIPMKVLVKRVLQEYVSAAQKKEAL